MPCGRRLDAPGVLYHHGPRNYADAAGDRAEWAWAKGGTDSHPDQTIQQKDLVKAHGTKKGSSTQDHTRGPAL